MLSVLAVACNNTVEYPVAGGHGHDHGAIAILLFAGDMELFAETDQLYAEHGVDIRAHLTFLEGYTPAENGILYARVIKGQKDADWEPLEMEKPGIFVGSIVPQDSGICDFQFMYQEDNIEVVFTEKSIKVYTHDDEAPEADTTHGDEAIFTKELAWETEFGLVQVELSEYRRAIHCSGEISITPGHTVDVISPAGGKIAYSGIDLVEGRYVREGSVLFTLLGTGLSHDNILFELSTARAEFEKSKANLERKAELLKIEAVSKKDYEEAKATFDTDKSRYDVLKDRIDESGMLVKSPVSGYIAEVLMAEKSFAEMGAVLVKIIKEGGVLVKANVPASHSYNIKSIETANIKLPHEAAAFSISEWGGKLSSYGKLIEPQTGMIPVYFQIDKPDLIPGTFVEIWLLTDAVSEQVVVPGTSLLEEYGSYYVYVQEGGEIYEKRQVMIADTDGINYLITSGLEPGEVIVSKGGMAIKVANAMGAAPVHTH